MKIRWTIAAFILGIIVGAAVRGGSPPAKEHAPEPALVRNNGHRLRDPAQKTPHATKWLAFGRRAKDMEAPEREKLIRELPPGDRMAALAALADQAGLEGLDPKIKAMMESILAEWGAENFDGLWTTAGDIENPHLRRFVLKTLLRQVSNDDPERAYRMHMEEVAKDTDFKSDAPNKVLDGRLKISAAEYLEVLAQTTFGDSTGGDHREFAPDFDFQKAADGVVRLIVENDHRQPPSFPLDFYRNWAAKDPEAAFKWWSENRVLPFGNVSEIIDAVEQRSPGTSAAWVASKLGQSAEIREKLASGIGAEKRDEIPSRVDSIIQELPNNQVRDSFLSDILVSNYPNNRFESYGFTFSRMSSPEARLEAFRRLGREKPGLQVSAIQDGQLQEWGLSRGQMEEALKAKP